MKKYISCESGVVTLEWVGISAVVVVAAFVITGFILGGADGQSGANGLAIAVTGQMDQAALDIVDPPDGS